jgi:hypothetical protein
MSYCHITNDQRCGTIITNNSGLIQSISALLYVFGTYSTQIIQPDIVCKDLTCNLLPCHQLG